MKYFKSLPIIWHKLIKDECQQAAAQLAFTTLLALVPLFITIFIALSIFPVYDGIDLKIESFIFNNFVPQTGQIVQNYLQLFQKNASQLSLISFLFLVINAILLIHTIERVFNKIFHAPKIRNKFKTFFLYWMVIALLPILIGIAMIISSKFLFTPLDPLLNLIQTILPFLLLWAALTAIYYFVPNCKMSFLSSVLGALFATILFKTAKTVFSWYVLNFNNFEVIYGALAALPLFLIWLYFLWMIILMGAEMTYFIGCYYFPTSSI